jgi:agmatinase
MTDSLTSRPANPGLPDFLAKPNTFMGVPFAPAPPAGTKAAILGIPFDCGTHPTRIGARQGPDAIRAQSSLVRPFQPPHADFSPIERLAVVDCGNVQVTPGVIEESFEAIERAVLALASAGVAPVSMGGDGAVTLPQLRALARVHPGLAVVHIDAHTDTYPILGNAIHQRHNTATTFTCAAREGVVDAGASFHIGPRGPIPKAGVFEFTRSEGYGLIDGRELYERGFADVLAEVHARLAGRPVYLCFDMDFFDPSCAPGVCTPTWGGASAREGLGLLRGLAGLDIVACDVNTVSPPHDVAGMTAFLAGTVMIECLTLLCRRPGPDQSTRTEKGARRHPHP